MIERDQFVGRDDELGRLESAWRDVARGPGRLITVAGAAGVGKTRLCEESAGQARHAGFTVVWGRCWADGSAPALWPWQAIMSELCGPDAAALLDTDGTERFTRFMAVADQLAAACERAPAFVVIDDLHAADPGALLLTRFVTKNLQRLRLALVVTRRTTSPEMTDLDREATPIVLRLFDLAETRSYLAANGLAHLDDTLSETIHGLTSGNPLFLRRLVAIGASDRDGALPEGLRDTIDHSLRHLDPHTVRLLSVSAILGHIVPLPQTAAIMDSSQVAVLGSLRAAAEVGLVNPVGPDEFEFSHDLVVQALAAKLVPAQRLEVHARAAQVATTAVFQAHHAIQAAARSEEDAQRAVIACRAAASSLVRGCAYEQAAGLLSTAAGLCQPVPADLLLQWASAVLMSGRLAEARQLFDQAAAASSADPVVFAEAALGLGGMWVNEHRDHVQRHRVLGLQRAALAGLPEEEITLRRRLEVRLAAEQVYSGWPIEDVLTAVGKVGQLGDKSALAEALSLCHHAMLAPEFTRKRLAVAESLLSVASESGVDILALLGLCWRTVDLFHLGDPRAERSLAELRTRADTLDCLSVQFIVGALDVMLLIRAGKLDEAEELAGVCFALGTKVGDADAFAYYGAHLLVIRWLQGRGAELVDLAEEIANSPTLVEGEFTFQATVARLAAEAGQYERARSVMERFAAVGVASLPRSSTWLAGMIALVEAAFVLDDTEIAREAYGLLLPYADLLTMPSLAVVCFGSTERTLGLAAMTFGDAPLAIEHFQRAIATNVRIGNRPLTAFCKADLAAALRRRSAPGDDHRAAQLLDGAIDEASAMQLTNLVESWKAVLATRRGAPVAVTMERQAGSWAVNWHGGQALLEDLVGVRYLAQLIAQPGVQIRAAELAYGTVVTSGNDPVLDSHARAAYENRARELAAELKEAPEGARAERLQLELDALTTELVRATGLGGRTRAFTGPDERARTAVSKAIKRAIKAIDSVEPALAAILRSTVSTGYVCVYTVPMG